MKKKIVLLFLLSFLVISAIHANIIDHNCTDITQIPQAAIENAKGSLHIAYGHTSHGSQLTTGMTDLVDFANGGGLGLSLPTDIFEWNNGGVGGALDLHDYAMSGDLGHNGDTTWVQETRNYLDNPANSDVNVIIWSWCGGCSDNTVEGINIYLNKMNELENDYPNVNFIYMTGHLDIWNWSNLKARNQQIRDYCIANNKILYDFADIESYDPDNTFFQYANDDCAYYSDSTGSNYLGNWAIEWQNTHIEGVDWYTCGAAHTQPLNANQKAYAAWWLWASLAGWNQCLPSPSDLTATADSEEEEISLSWLDNSHDPNEDSFIIQRQVDGGVWNNYYDSVATDITTYVDSGLVIGTYSYRIVAHLNDDGSGNPCNSGPSNIATDNIVSTDPPLAPSDLNATGDSQNQTIALGWTDNSDNEIGFFVQRKVGSGVWNDNYDTLTANTTIYNDTGLVPETYTYRIVAYNSYGNSSPSNEAGATILDIPLPPTELQATGNSLNGTVSLTWIDNSDNEDEFIIQQQFNGGAWNNSYDTVISNSTTYLDNNNGSPPLPNGTYNYRVVASNSHGASNPSNESSAIISSSVPEAPSDLASELNDFDITLTWIDNSDNEENFILERKVDTGTYSILVNLPPNTENYLDENLAPLHTYTYRVKATNNFGDSDYSNETSEYIAQETYTITLKHNVDGYTGCRDAYLDADHSTYNYGNTPYKYVKNSPKCNFAISFDLPAEVMGKQILEATLGFYCWSVSSWQENQYLELYRITEEWEEGTGDGYYQSGSSSWNIRSGVIEWTTPGGTFNSQLLDSSLIPNSSYYPEFDITDLTQEWVDSTVSNYGVLLINNSFTTTGIKASEYSEYGRPYLEIEYTNKPTYLDAPENVIITIDSDSIYINWDTVTEATSYKVYSSNNPYTDFTEDTSGTFDGVSWSAPIGDMQKFYYVVAVN